MRHSVAQGACPVTTLDNQMLITKEIIIIEVLCSFMLPYLSNCSVRRVKIVFLRDYILSLQTDRLIEISY